MNPSVYSQAFSKPRYAVNESKQLEFDKVVDQLYDNTVFDKQSVCSQWPDDCGKTDGQFIDGYYTDQCSLALNIGQYQTQNSDDTTSEGEEPLKVILNRNIKYSLGKAGNIKKTMHNKNTQHFLEFPNNHNTISKAARANSQHSIKHLQ